MDNWGCQAYAIVALKNLIKQGIVQGDKDAYKALDSELKYLFDMYTENEIKEKAEKVLMEE